MTKITSQVVAQGSYGISKINPRNGEWRGHVINVWHLHIDGRYIGTFRTRAEARAAA